MKRQQIEKLNSLKKAQDWFESKNWKPFKYQHETWLAFLEGKSGLLNAPTGSGKTYALWIPAIIDLIETSHNNQKPSGLRIIWITPLRALAKDIQLALRLFVDDMDLDWVVDIRTGDTTTSQRTKQLKSPPYLPDYYTGELTHSL